MPELTTVSPRIPNFKPNPDSMAGVQQIVKEIYAGGVPRKTLEHPDAVTDEIWARAADHFDESALADARVDGSADQLLQPHQHHPPHPTRDAGMTKMRSAG